MKKAALAVIISLFAYQAAVYASCKTDACKRAVAWKDGYTAIVLDDAISPSDYYAVLDAVKANKGVVAIEAERVLLGWVPTSAAGKIRATRGVRAVLYDAVAHPADLVTNDKALPALEFFNHVLTGEYEDAVEAGLGVKGEPLIGCVNRIPLPIAHAQTLGIGEYLDGSAALGNRPVGAREQNALNGTQNETNAR